MAISFRCLKCSKIIKCEQYDKQILFEHIKTDHPDINLLENDSGMEKLDNEETLIGTKVGQCLPDIDIHMEETTIRSPELKPIYTRKYKVTKPLTPRSPQKRRMYKTSIEKWKPAKGNIYCPKCGATKKPIIKTKSEKRTYSPIEAACILTCWPLCLIPFFQAPSKDYLYCAECLNFLGMYDKQRNCIRPNINYVEADECQKQTLENSIGNCQNRESSK